MIFFFAIQLMLTLDLGAGDCPIASYTKTESDQETGKRRQNKSTCGDVCRDEGFNLRATRCIEGLKLAKRLELCAVTVKSSNNTIYRNQKKEKSDAYLLQRSFIGANALNQRNCERIELIGLVSFVDDGQRDAEVEVLEIANLLGQRNNLREEIDTQAERVTTTADTRTLCIDSENAARDAQVSLLDTASPVFENLLRI